MAFMRGGKRCLVVRGAYYSSCKAFTPCITRPIVHLPARPHLPFAGSGGIHICAFSLSAAARVINPHTAWNADSAAQVQLLFCMTTTSPLPTRPYRCGKTAR